MILRLRKNASSACPIINENTTAFFSPSFHMILRLTPCCRVTRYYPSTLDTPGLVQENLSKPKETREIEGSVVTFKPEQAAAHLFSGTEKLQTKQQTNKRKKREFNERKPKKNEEN